MEALLVTLGLLNAQAACGSAPLVHETMVRENGYRTLFVLRGEQSSFILYRKETKWVLFAVVGDQLCMVGAGAGIEVPGTPA